MNFYVGSIGSKWSKQIRIPRNEGGQGAEPRGYYRLKTYFEHALQGDSKLA